MPYLGAHMSISGGLEKAIERIIAVEGTALQIFSKNQRQWRSPKLTQKQIDAFASARKQWGDYPIAVHDSYLINLASPKEDAAAKSVGAFADELQRAEALDIPYVVTHPGSHLGEGIERGVELVAARIDEAVELSETTQVMILLENTAGQGTGMGAGFAELGGIISASKYGDRIGMCLDTAHAFAAGYDLASSEGYTSSMDELEREVGLDKLKFIHANDSKVPLGSRVDRHAHIGEGHLGEIAFANLLNDPRIVDIPMVLETPKGEDLEEDRRNLSTLRRLIEK